MKAFWIFGAGQFGEKAAVRLRLKYTEASIVVVDQDRSALCSVEAMATSMVLGDAVGYLAEHLTVSEQPDWIVAAVPVHWLLNGSANGFRRLSPRKTDDS